MNWANLEIRHLRYFVGVAEHGSFRAAALQLHVSQPPLTRQIQQLEETLGVKLLLRRPRGVELTTAGRVFYEEARNILGLTEQAAARASLAGQGQLGRLDIGIFGSAIFNTIPRIIQAFRARFPRVEVELHNLDRGQQLKALRERRITVGFNRFFDVEPDMKCEVVQSEQIHVAVPKSNELARRKAVTLQEISRETLILYPRRPRPSFIDQALRQFHTRGLTPRTINEVDDLVTAIALVASGFGISLVTDSACNLQLPGVAYLPLARDDRMHFDLCMIYRNDDESALLKAFVETANQTCRASAVHPAR